MNLFKWSDASCIPKLLNRFMKERVVSAYVMGAAVLRGKIALENVLDYLRLMGVQGPVVNELDFARHQVLDFLDRAVGIDGLYSVQSVL